MKRRKLKSYKSISLSGLGGSKTASFFGNYFIINAEEQNYYHFLMDQIGQFLYLKSINKSLKLLILSQESEHSAEYADWLLKAIKEDYDYDEIKLSEHKAVYIEEISVISNRLINFYHLIDDNLSDSIWDLDYAIPVLGELRKFLLSKIKTTSPTKNVLLSRGAKNEYFAKEHETIMARGGPTTELEMESVSRYLSKEEYFSIVNVFEGYEEVLPENASFEDQIAACANAKNIVVFIGASVINTIVADSSCNIFIVNTDTRHPIPKFHDLLDKLSPNVTHALDPRISPATRDVERVVSLAKEFVA